MLSWSQRAVGQGSWTTEKNLFSDNQISVTIKFYISDDGCGGKQMWYKYKLSNGSLRNHEYYINWKIDYIDCTGNLKFRTGTANIGLGANLNMTQVNRSDKFAAQSIESEPYDISTSYQSLNGKIGIRTPRASSPPNSIIGNKSIKHGESSNLKIQQGTLGLGAEWVWYEGNCGNGREIGLGEEIRVSPKKSTVYYVRAEGGSGPTKCTSIAISVDDKSYGPSSISGKTNICVGDETKLQVVGGILGPGARWVWYQNACEGRRIGTGESITVDPLTNTTYSVRAEGPRNKTFCEKVIVRTYQKSKPASAINGSIRICEDEKTTLYVNGGKLSAEADWIWYEKGCGTKRLGSGSSIKVNPKSTTSYFVRAEGGCNTTNCESQIIRVDKKSAAPLYIYHKSDVTKNETVKLSIVGGSLGTGAKWQWYRGTCGGKSIGEGSSVSIKARKPTKIFARAEGKCNSSLCKSVTLNPRKAHRIDPLYTNKTNALYHNKFLQTGVGIGLDWTSFSSLSESTQIGFSGIDTTKESHEVSGIGLKGEYSFHPYITDVFGVGFIFAGAVGTTTSAIQESFSNQFGRNTQEKYLYTKLDGGLEITAGGRPIKVLLGYKSSIQTHNYFTDQSNKNANYLTRQVNLQVRKEVLSAGIRLAPYSRVTKKRKRAINIDLMYNLSRDYPWSWSSFNWSYSPLSDWGHGFGFSLWWHGVLKLQLETVFKSELGANYNTGGTKGTYFNFSLIYNRNWFY